MHDRCRTLRTQVQCLSETAVPLLLLWQNTYINTGESEAQGVVYNSNSEEQFALDDSDTESTHNLPENSDDSVLTNQVWRDGRNDDRATYSTVFIPAGLILFHIILLQILVIWQILTNIYATAVYNIILLNVECGGQVVSTSQYSLGLVFRNFAQTGILWY
jgi:hypothetical protein